jgi:hypothetical protein
MRDGWRMHNPPCCHRDQLHTIKGVGWCGTIRQPYQFWRDLDTHRLWAKVILMTAFGCEAMRQQALAAGA